MNFEHLLVSTEAQIRIQALSGLEFEFFRILRCQQRQMAQNLLGNGAITRKCLLCEAGEDLRHWGDFATASGQSLSTQIIVGRARLQIDRIRIIPDKMTEM